MLQIEGFINLEKLLVEVNVKFVDGMDLAIVNLKVSGEMIIQSTRTLKPIKYNFNDHDELTYSFSSNQELEDDSIIEVDNNEIDLHDEIVSLIITSLPIKIVGKDEPESFSEDNWEVISEDQYNSRSKIKSSPFDILNELDID